MASDMGVPFLGRLPLDPRIAKCCDEGKSFLREVPDSPAAKAYAAIIKGACTIQCISSDIVLSCSSCRETTRILCGQLNA